MARHKSPFGAGGGGGGSRRDPRQTWEQALAAHRAGELEKAEKLYRSLLKLVPDQLDALANLSAVLERRGRFADALKMVTRALEVDATRAALHGIAGRAHLGVGRPDRAASAFRRWLGLEPSSVDARCDLARALEAQDDSAAAEAALRDAVEADPRSARAAHDLGAFLFRAGRFGEADAAIDALLRTDPKQVAGWILRGNIARARDDAVSAIEAYRHAAELAPGAASVWLNLGQVMFEAGQREDAIAAYRRAAAVAPDRSEPTVLLAAAKRHTERDDEFARLEMLAKDPRRAAGVEPHVVLFAHAKALEDLGEHERSFDVLVRANAAKRKHEPYDRAAAEARFARLREVFTSELLARHEGSGFEDETPVFVVGMPRSATSLVEQILASHSEVFGAGELNDLSEILEDESRFPGRAPDGFVEVGPAALRAAGEDYVTRVRRRAPDARRIVDKAPLNSLWIGAIRCILPRARIIACVRDPRDTCWSIFRHDFAGSYSFGDDLADLGAFHRQHDELMAHWREVVGPEHLLSVRYEELVEDLDGHVRRLCAFLGLPFDPACLEFHRTARSVRTASAHQVKQPLFRSSIGAWRRHEARLGPLLDALRGP